MTALAKNPAIVKLRANAESLAAVVDVLPLATPADEQQAADILGAIKDLVREAEDERKRLVAPYKREAAAVDAAFRGPRKILETIEARLRRRLAEAAEAREATRRAALAEAAEAARTGAAEAANAAIVRASDAAAAAEGPEGISYRWTWAAEVEDPAAVPREFLAVDVAALERYAAAAGAAEPAAVPGVRFVRRATTVRRG